MKISPWMAVAACVLLSTIADTLGTTYWENRRLIALAAVVVLGPVVFLLFGYVGANQGLATASGITNSLIVAGPIVVGLVARRELEQLAVPQLLGLLLILAGLGAVALFRPDGGSSQ